MTNLEYFEKLQELIKQKAELIEFIALYTEKFGESPSEQLKNEYEVKVLGYDTEDEDDYEDEDEEF